MNKNIVIGLLAVVIVLGGGYYLLATNNQIAPIDQNNNNPIPTTPSTPVTPVIPVIPLILGTPTVETSPNVSTSISTALVSGKIIPNGISTTYWFEYGETTALGNKTSAQIIGSGFSAISSPGFIAGLRANTSYYFRLSAHNNFGTASGASYTFTTNSTPPVKAAVPTAHTSNANSILRVSANLNGQVNPNGWQTNYWFEYGKDNNLGNITSISSATPNTSLSSLDVTASVSGLDPLTRYYFRVNAQNQFGTVTGTTLSFTTQGPLNPGIPVVTTNQASNITSTSVRLNGRVNPGGVDATYWFEYSNDSLMGSIINGGTPVQNLNAGTNTTNVQANLSGLSKNIKYFYRLVGKNQYGTIYGSINSFSTKQ